MHNQQNHVMSVFKHRPQHTWYIRLLAPAKCPPAVLKAGCQTAFLHFTSCPAPAASQTLPAPAASQTLPAPAACRSAATQTNRHLVGCCLCLSLSLLLPCGLGSMASESSTMAGSQSSTGATGSNNTEAGPRSDPGVVDPKYLVMLVDHVSAAKMLRVKRRARDSNGQHEIRKRVKEVSSIFSDCKDTVESMIQKLCWKEISQELATKFFASIVSLASFDGDKLHYESTGIVVENSLRNTCILTSSALVSTSDRERKFIYGLEIKLRLPNNQVVDGWIQHYDLPFSMVVVVTRYSPDLRTVCFSDSVQVQQHTNLLALKRCFESGKLMQTHGVPSDDPSKTDSKGSMLSTCKITMDGSGGPLVDLDGNIVGMNDYHDQEGTPYVQGNKIDECLRVVRIRREEIQRHCRQNFSSAFRRHLEGSSNQNGYSGGSESKKQKQFLSSNPEPQALEFTEDVPTPELIDDEHKLILDPWPSNGFTKMVNALLNKDGYPLPDYADGGMHLEGNFEEEFGRDNLSEPARKIALKMSRSVVALASFSPKKRHFACTGVCIDFNGSTSTTRVLTSASLVRTSGDENKIFDNLEIKVCLPNEVCLDGKLEKYDLCYNVAVISYQFRCNSPAMLVDAPQTEVLALGRVFKSGNSMATEGSVAGKKCKFGCEELKISTCKITKAGIGGPLLDFKGNVVGMNFYDTEGTPYLPSKIILEVLRSFDAERPVAAGITKEPVAAGITKKPNSRSHIGITRVNIVTVVRLDQKLKLLERDERFAAPPAKRCYMARLLRCICQRFDRCLTRCYGA